MRPATPLRPAARDRPRAPARDLARDLAGDYVELRVRSAFSFLEGASEPEDLVERAAELGYPALALGDRGGVYGGPRFHRAAVAAGLRAIQGAEVSVAPPPAARERRARKATGARSSGSPSLCGWRAGKTGFRASSSTSG